MAAKSPFRPTKSLHDGTPPSRTHHRLESGRVGSYKSEFDLAHLTRGAAGLTDWIPSRPPGLWGDLRGWWLARRPSFQGVPFVIREEWPGERSCWWLWSLRPDLWAPGQPWPYSHRAADAYGAGTPWHRLEVLGIVGSVHSRRAAWDQVEGWIHNTRNWEPGVAEAALLGCL